MPDQEIILYRDSSFELIGDNEQSRFIRAPDDAQCVPLTDTGMVIFLVQPSPAFAQELLTLPGGPITPHENSKQAANRELQQEIGFYANQMDFLGELHPWSKYLDVRTYLYLARDLAPSNLYQDERDEIKTELVALENFERLITSGRLHDSTMISGLYLARHFLQDERRRRGGATASTR